ncbi:hypothetical protein MMC30_006701 [Trapelia coarctata]|nr:hypothetical protein [Trapelia coarctata]
MSQPIPTPLPCPRLVVTTYAQDGTSIFASDDHPPTFQPFGPNTTAFHLFHSRLTVPVSNTSYPPNLSTTLPRCPPQGVLFCTTDIMPGGKAQMHRTLSLDYIAVIAGEIVLRLDGGEEKTVRAGEFIVQGGVNHEWINRSEGVCRLMVVMVGAEKVVLEDGRELEDSAFKNVKDPSV